MPTKEDLQMANEYKSLCEQANAMCQGEVKEGTDAGNGWKKVTHKYDKRSNCKVVLYEKNGKYAIAFVGTDRKEKRKDWGANLKMAATGSSAQIEMAKEFVKDLQREHKLTTENTVSIGHSEGGTEATHVGLENGFRTFTYNAYGISDKFLNKDIDYSEWVINFRDPNDPVSKMKANIGTTYITPPAIPGKEGSSILGRVKSHGIEVMGDCSLAIHIDEYKKRHPSFVSQIDDMQLTGRNIGDMEPELYDIYDRKLLDKLSKGEIAREEDIKQGRGPVKVESYTRDDGTVVEGYYRRLPGTAA